MKKSKVIIPAMALLLFSTAASITGTVAWFSSTRVFETSVGQFSVSEIDGNLECAVAKDVGTVAGDTANTVKVPTANNLIDASLNASATTPNPAIDIYRKSREATNAAYFKKYDKGETGNNDWLYRTVSETEKYYLAVSWTLTFTYTFNAETAPLDVILDLNKSTFTEAEAATGSVHNTALGFRIAFVTNSKITVWGNRAPESGPSYAKIKHVTGVGESNTAEYTGSNYFVANAAEGYAATIDDNANHSTMANCIGSISKGTGGKGTLAVTCVAYFEGTDPDVVSGTAEVATKLQTLSATLSFFGRSGLAG